MEVITMSFYAKNSLFALLAMGTILGMEQPRLQHPAQSAAAQALNQPMIEITCNGARIDRVPKNHLKVSETFKNLLQETEHANSLELLATYVADYQAIKDLLQYEYRLQNETIEQEVVLTQLNPKTEQQLVAILNACQRFELNIISEFTAKVLAKKLDTLTRKDECLKKGSYNLNWTPDVAHLVTQKMIESDNASKTMTLIYWLAQATLTKNGNITFQDLDYADSNGAQFRFTHLFDLFPSPTAAYFGPVAIVKAPRRSIFENMFCVPFAALSQDEQQNIKILLQLAYGNATYTNTYLPRLKYAVVEKYPEDYLVPPREWVGLYYLHAQELENHINKKLLPEELVLMEYCFKCQKEQQEYNYVTYPGLEKFKSALPREFKTLLFPNWWQRRNWLSKAAIITGSAAATGLAAWFGYKYFSKK